MEGIAMRMGFWMGGLIGAAAAIYLSRNRGMLMTSMQSGNMGRVMNTAKSALQGAAMKAMDATLTRKMNASSQMDQAADMAKVEQIVNEDPALKQTVNEILSEDKTSSYGSH